MARKKSGVPKQKAPRLLNIATHLPDEEPALLTHCSASWGEVQKDTAHFGAQITAATGTLTPALAALGLAVTNSEGGGPVETAELKAAAEQVRQAFNLMAKSLQPVLRGLPPDQVPAILANILMYASNVGARPPKKPFDVLQPADWPSGSVHLVALAVLGALTYGYEVSLDQQSWTVQTSGKCQATVVGLTPGKLYYFRFRCFLRDDTLTAYSTVIGLIVR
jgi:hypothetical protein